MTARHLQIMTLTSLLLYGCVKLGFETTTVFMVLVVASSLFTQYLFSHIYAIRFDAKSALITGLSLAILLRSPSVSIALLAGFIAIGSKFLLRTKKGHIFNPANLALTIVIVGTGNAWISPGQWGHETLLVFAFTAAAILVLSKAARIDIALYFLGSYGGLLLLRALYLGDPLILPFHAMQSGALLLFSFFMITDPKTTPENSLMRFFFAVLVAIIAFIFQFQFYISAGFIYGLTITSLLWALFQCYTPKHSYVIFSSSR